MSKKEQQNKATSLTLCILRLLAFVTAFGMFILARVTRHIHDISSGGDLLFALVGLGIIINAYLLINEIKKRK